MLGLGAKTIGLTLDQTGARIVYLKKKKNWELDRAKLLPLKPGMFEEDQITDPEALRAQLSQWVKAERLQGAVVTLAFPASQVIIRRLRIQSTNAKELHSLVALEVETTLHLPFEDPVHDYVKVEEDAESTQVLVFAASRLLILQYVDLLESAGLKVGGIELSATALARAIRQQADEAFNETMLINLDANALEIYMFHNGFPVFSRTIALYGMQTGEDGALDPNQLSEVTAEIARMLNFYQFSIHEGTTRITETLIVGSEGGRRQLLTELQQTQPDMTIRAIAFDAYAQKPDDHGDKNRVGIGLALWHHDKQHIDLLPRLDREAKMLPAILAGALVVWLLALGALGYFYMDYRSDVSANKQSIQQLNDQLTLLESGLAAKNNAQSGQTNPLEIIESIKHDRRDAVAVLKELNSKLPQGSVLQTVSYNSFGQIGLTVQFKSLDDTSRYLFDLRLMSFTAAAQLQSVTSSSASESTGTISADSDKLATYSLAFKQPEGGKQTSENAGSSAQ